MTKAIARILALVMVSPFPALLGCGRDDQEEVRVEETASGDEVIEIERDQQVDESVPDEVDEVEDVIIDDEGGPYER
jgi:hypothetical protein